jgi:hypothetical protein
MSAAKSVVTPQSEQAKEPSNVNLAHGRTLTVSSAGGEQLVEIRGSSGIVELRVKITDEGPVLLMESVRISLKAAESVDVECKQFNVNASQSIELKSQEGIQVSGKADVRVEANGEVHVKGEMIYLN